MAESCYLYFLCWTTVLCRLYYCTSTANVRSVISMRPIQRRWIEQKASIVVMSS